MLSCLTRIASISLMKIGPASGQRITVVSELAAEVCAALCLLFNALTPWVSEDAERELAPLSNTLTF